MTRKKIYRKALIVWGRTFQIDMLVEECAGLIRAAQEFNHRHGSVKDVIEKLVDVEIMCEQMRLVFDPVDIDEVKEQKLVRLKKTLCL